MNARTGRVDSVSRRDRRTETVPTDSAAPPPGAAAGGAPSAVSAGLTHPADGAPTGSAADLRCDESRNQTPPAVRAAGGVALPRAFALSGSVRTSQSSKPFAAADDVSLVISDVFPDTLDAHVDRALAVGGFPVDALGPRLVEPAPVTDPALREPPRVWIAIRRTGIDRHRLKTHPDTGFTSCGRSAHVGHLLPADDPWIVEHTQPCLRCWPGGA